MAAAVASPLPADDRIGTERNYRSQVETYYKNVASTKLPPPSTAPTKLEHTKQGSVKPLTIIDSPADWTAASFKSAEEYTYEFTEADVKELTAAVDKLKARGVGSEQDVAKLTKDDYELPTLRPKLLDIAKQVSLGRGFHLIRGFPVQQYKGDRLGLVLAFWGIGVALGRAQISQTDYDNDKNTFGSLLNHVTVGRSTHLRPGRTDGTDSQIAKPPRDFNLSRLVFHNDQAATDLIALLSVTASKSGGESKWVSGVAIHNELLRRGRKDLVEVLSDAKQWLTPRKKDQSSFERNEDGSFKGFEATPPFEYHDGWFTVHYAVNNYLEKGDLTPLQEEAMWTFATLAEDPAFHLSKVLQPGEIEILHNPTVLHSRGDIEDGETNEEKRHLLRWWIAQPKEQNPRPTAPSFAPRSLTLPEGGFRVPEGSTLRLPFYPYTRHDGEGQSAY